MHSWCQHLMYSQRNQLLEDTGNMQLPSRGLLWQIRLSPANQPISSLPSSDFLVVTFTVSSTPLLNDQLRSASDQPQIHEPWKSCTTRVLLCCHETYLCASATADNADVAASKYQCINCQHPASEQKNVSGTLSMLSSAVAASSKSNGPMIAMHSQWQDAKLSVQPASGGKFSMPIRKGASYDDPLGPCDPCGFWGLDVWILGDWFPLGSMTSLSLIFSMTCSTTASLSDAWRGWVARAIGHGGFFK